MLIFGNKMLITTPDAWRDSMKHYQKNFIWNDVIGRIPVSQIPLNPHSRKIFDEATWAGYEITLDVLPGFFDWGYFLIPKDIKPDEKRPVMVVQHGGSGLPKDVMDKNNKYYKGLAIQLVERGWESNRCGRQKFLE